MENRLRRPRTRARSRSPWHRAGDVLNFSNGDRFFRFPLRFRCAFVCTELILFAPTPTCSRRSQAVCRSHHTRRSAASARSCRVADVPRTGTRRRRRWRLQSAIHVGPQRVRLERVRRPRRARRWWWRRRRRYVRRAGRARRHDGHGRRRHGRAVGGVGRQRGVGDQAGPQERRGDRQILRRRNARRPAARRTLPRTGSVP